MLRITDHALVRYLERCRGIDMQEIRDYLAEEIQKVYIPGAAYVPFEGAYAIFDAGALITIRPDRPKVFSHRGNDQEFCNGTDAPRTRLPWRGYKRKRAHK